MPSHILCGSRKYPYPLYPKLGVPEGCRFKPKKTLLAEGVGIFSGATHLHVIE